MSMLINCLFKRLGIKIKTVTPLQSSSFLQARHGIKALVNIFTKHLTGQGQCWPNYLPFAIYSFSTFSNPNLNVLSPYELVFGRKARVLTNLETDLIVKVSGTYNEYFISY